MLVLVFSVEDFQFVGENRKRPNTGYATPKSAKKGRNDDFEDRILKAIEQESAETSFGKMVGQSLASLSIRSRAIAKLKIQEVLTYAALESIDVLPPPPRPPSM
uniref:Uncharacterized protein n=1 Tax=Ditylenchus dipsaci TaxID=166011 RepID=A0A915DF47_9BILA